MKLIIDLDEEVYKRTKFYREFRDLNDCVITLKAIDNAVPLEDIKTEIQKALDEDKATDTENAKVQAIALMWCLEVIDKHIGGKE